jgi:FtsP/CotA-like multicopper oxidase with cupredoxin domain
VLDREQVLVLGDVTAGRSEDFEPLVNGVSQPVLGIAAGQIERWRVVNASSARYVRLSIGGTTFQILGTDGGLLERPVPATEVLLAPSDRVEIAAGPFEERDDFAIEALAHAGDLEPIAQRLAMVRVGPPRLSIAVIPAHFRSILPLAPPSALPNRTLDFGMRDSPDGDTDFLVNQEKNYQDAPVRVGELQVWDIVNSTSMDHPFHLHGFFFQVLAIDGQPPAWRSWEDVVNLPPWSTTRIAWLPDDRPGRWMYHCHILGHHAAGMMAHFDVVR